MNKKEKFMKEFADALREVQQAEEGAAELESFDEMIDELRTNHGGKRAGAGRKTDDLKAYTIWVSASEKEMINKLMNK